MITKSRNAIDEIMRNFDFARVQRVMTALNWKWADQDAVPTETELRREADRLLCILDEELTFVGCGGFQAERHADGTYELRFVLTEWQGGHEE